MISNELLQMFCSRDDFRTVLTVPFNVGNYTYATNGHFAIRVDLRKEFSGNDTPANMEKCFAYPENVDEALFIDIPELNTSENSVSCKVCGGKGTLTECSDCEGTGEVHWESDGGYEYESDCQMCNGSGKINEQCEKCGGTGKKFIEQFIEVGTRVLNCKLLSIINSLPGVKIAPDATSDFQPIPFRFDGGCGILMPGNRAEWERQKAVKQEMLK